MDNQLVVVKRHLGKGGALCKEFNRVRQNDELDWRTEQAYALEMIKNSAQLQRCDPATIGRSMVDLAVMGLSLSPAMKEAYLIPYKNSCTASPSYMGLVQIVLRTGVVTKVETDVVREGDEWKQWSESGEKRFRHVIGDKRGEVTHAWAAFHLINGDVKIEIMDQEALRGCRDAAAKKNGGEVPFVWKGPFKEQMYKKCAIRRGWNLLPKLRDHRAVAAMEAVERTDPMDFSESRVVNESYTLSSDQVNELISMMATAGVNAQAHDAWLAGLAKRLGYKGIRHVNEEDFDKAKSLMKEGLERWQTLSTSEPSDSGQGATTAQGAAT